MGIDTRAVIVVGYTYDKIKEVYDKWEESTDAGDCHFYEWCGDNELEMISPCYDANSEKCLFGTVIDSSRDYSYSKVNIDDVKVRTVFKDLTDKFGIIPSFYLSPYVW